jgi:hypothetical protein
MNEATTIPAPPGWGSDKLSDFLQQVINHQFATFVNLRPAFDLLGEVDACFLPIAENMVNPRRNQLSVLLLYRAHAAFRAACGSSMAGQSPETFVVLRSCLEYSGYALLIHQKPELGVVWLNRHEDPAKMREMRRQFQAVNVENSIRSADARLGEVYSDLYNRAIDFGGHPNTRGLTGSMQLEESEEGSHYMQIYLHGNDMPLRHCRKSTAQAGVCSLHIFQHIFSERFMLLGIRDKLIKLRTRL